MRGATISKTDFFSSASSAQSVKLKHKLCNTPNKPLTSSAFSDVAMRGASFIGISKATTWIFTELKIERVASNSRSIGNVSHGLSIYYIIVSSGGTIGYPSLPLSVGKSRPAIAIALAND